MPNLELEPAGRSHALREMFWNREHEQYLDSRVLAGSGQPTLVGRARDFALLLDATPPVFQPRDLLAGIALLRPAEGSTLDLGHYDGHYTPGHANLVRLGYSGIRARAQEKLETEVDPARRGFLEATVIAYEAASRFAARHAVAARVLAESTEDPVRRADLVRTGQACDQLACGPPASFHAGLQMVWFTFLFGGRGSIGRLDQWLYPLYRRDRETGRLSREGALELLENYFVKLNYFAGNNDSLRNLALAGQTPSGEDACNPLTLLCLEAAGRLMLPEPKLNVRFFEGSPPELLELSCRLTCKGLSNPAYFNDRVAIPGLLRLGIPLEDARDYCNDGCSELIIGGRSTISFTNFDTLPLLNETVARGAAEGFPDFPAVVADFEERLEEQIGVGHHGPVPVTFPYFAASLDDCLEAASPAGARYGICGRIPSQMGNVADGLAAIRRFVFEERSLSWTELYAALQRDFAGCEGLRQKLLNRAPKYGNDDDEVDAILKEVSEHFCEALHQRAGNRPGPGLKLAPGFMTFGIHGRRFLPATPDGRRRGDNVASSFSPGLGRDRNSPTAVLRSASKVDLRKAGHGSVLDIAFHPSALQADRGFGKFVALVRTFLDLPCTTTLQVNLIDRQTLEAARDNPADPRYRTLLVRVWGFSAVFVALDPALQQHVIERTEHGLG
ncbi:MAG: pyruvate formate lyase family protein [Candidatus Latescibacterota bacterium]